MTFLPHSPFSALSWECRRAARIHWNAFERWRFEQCRREYREWLRQHPVISYDRYKEHPDRDAYDSLLRWASYVLSGDKEGQQKKQHLRERWALPPYLHVTV